MEPIFADVGACRADATKVQTVFAGICIGNKEFAC